MKKIYIILLSIIGVISSCTKHEDIIDTSLQPGSILCSDGSIVHPSLFSPNEKEAIGVVFWCNDGNNPNIKEKNSLIYQLITKGDIFLEPTEAKKVSVNNE